MFAVGLPAVIGGLVLLALAFVVLSSVHFIPNNKVGIVEKRFSFGGSLRSGLIALAGEAGYQPNVLRGGVHLFMPLQYRIHKVPLVTVPQGRIGYVFARDGRALGPMQTLGDNRVAKEFQDAESFLRSGGQKGPQRLVLREGTYAINLAQFCVMTEAKVYSLPLTRDEEALFQRMTQQVMERAGYTPLVIKGSDDLIGVVTVHDGPTLEQGQLIAPVVGDQADLPGYHNSFQDPEGFLAAGGRRGRQLHVLSEGTYFINCLFATVELIPKTVVEVGTVGVVVSYTGATGSDLSGQEYKHGELVKRGERGVWSEPLLPGKYAFNTYAGKVIMVPTTNFILKWSRTEVGQHRFDENLSEVSLITKDAFEPRLPLSVVVHIDYRKAPLVVQRFGDVKRLVEQTLDPMVAAYFKNIGQTRTVIQLLQERSLIQGIAGEEMKARFSRYNLELEEVLIGTPASATGDAGIEHILEQLRSRQIAEEQILTYAQQEKASGKERSLREARARAEHQGKLTASELEIQVQANQGRAAYQRSREDADCIRTLAEADAERIARVGMAQAIATEEQVRAYGGPRFQVTQEVMGKLSEAIAQAKIDIVPRVMVGGGKEGGAGNMIEALLAMLMSPDAGGGKTEAAATTAPKELVALRDRVRGELLSTLGPAKSNGKPALPEQPKV
jgi:uncharacterized membrane protein YqiK